MARLNGGGPITPSSPRKASGRVGHTRPCGGRTPAPSSLWALDHMARYVSEVYLQNFTARSTPILLGLEENKRRGKFQGRSASTLRPAAAREIALSEVGEWPEFGIRTGGWRFSSTRFPDSRDHFDE